MIVTGAEWVGILGGAATVIAALGTSTAMVISAIHKVNEKVDTVKKQTDGLIQGLLGETRINSEAKGHAVGVAQEQVRAIALKQGQDQTATEAAKIQAEAARVQREAAEAQNIAAQIQNDTAQKKAEEDKEGKK